MSNKVGAVARVQIIVEFPVNSTWGEDCPLSQIHKQASEEVLGMIAEGAQRHHMYPHKIIGEPIVKCIIAERERG